MSYAEQALPTFTALMKAQSTPLPIPQVMRDNGPTPLSEAVARRNRLMGFKPRTVRVPVAVIEAPIEAPAVDLESVQASPEPIVPPPEYRARDILYVNFDPLHCPPISQAETIIRQVQAKHKLGRGEMLGRQRSARVVLARQEAAWRMKRETTLSLPQIGRKLGGRDHTTVLHNIRQYEAKLNGTVYNPKYRALAAAALEALAP